MSEGSPDGRTMKYWLMRTLRDARVRSDVSTQDIALLVDADQSTVHRFEHNESFPRNFDAWVAAYSYALGLEDGRELWGKALSSWQKQGGVPVLGPLSPAQRARLLAVEAALRRLPDADEPRGEPNATPKRREAG